MCLAVPGLITRIDGDDPMLRTARVNFGGIIKDVSLAYVPEAEIGQYVVVHVGFALSIVDEDEAKRVFEYLDAMNELAELELEPAGAGPPAGTTGPHPKRDEVR
jgi:hydrogenase expression/formation protein HypC